MKTAVGIPSLKSGGAVPLQLIMLLSLMAPRGATAQTYTVLHTFTAGDAEQSYGTLIRDPAGNLYGTGTEGGAYNYGAVFKITPKGAETVLYSFGFYPDGQNPEGTLAIDAAGNLYGTTLNGGDQGSYYCYNSENSVCGTVFKVEPNGSEEVLFNFDFTDGANPAGGVVMDSAGNLYGTTSGGGSVGPGVVFELSPSGQETILYNFSNAAVFSGVTRDGGGNLYGTSGLGGSYGAGMVYRVTPDGHESAVYNFTGGSDGGDPLGTLIFDASGNMYGETSIGGDTSCQPPNGCGTVFKLDRSGQETVLYSFHGGTDGLNPVGGVVMDSAGNLYGTTVQGGNAPCHVRYGSTGCGVVFKLDTAGNETALYAFKGKADGAYPRAGLLIDPAGNLYGTTQLAGDQGGNGFGVVFKVKP